MHIVEKVFLDTNAIDEHYIKGTASPKLIDVMVSYVCTFNPSVRCTVIDHDVQFHYQWPDYAPVIKPGNVLTLYTPDDAVVASNVGRSRGGKYIFVAESEQANQEILVQSMLPGVVVANGKMVTINGVYKVDGKNMVPYVGTKHLLAKPMTRGDYNHYRAWTMPEGENSDDQGYLVEYLDSPNSNHPNHENYISWSPKETFEEAYQVSGEMTFSGALYLLRCGFTVARKSWVDGTRIKLVERGRFDVGCDTVEETTLAPYIGLLAGGRFLPYVASQDDLLADDWVVVK